MCGIAGTIGFADRSLLEEMTRLITHRGPDDSGIEVFETGAAQIGFGFRRLSILDLSPLGHQPMFSTAHLPASSPAAASSSLSASSSGSQSASSSGSQSASSSGSLSASSSGSLSASSSSSLTSQSLCIIFNGEIYNYQEIRQALLAKGYSFRSGTDTEVILHAYREWGTACVSRFNGMWAFALYDAEKNLVFLSRDRLGVKPIYYTRLSGNRIVFGSEVKSLLACKEVNRQADVDGVLSTLFFLWTPEPKTAFKGIEKLPAGYNMIISLDPSGGAVRDVRLEKYWDIEFTGYGEDKGEKRYAEELLDLLHDSIRLRLIADVNVGAFLSGGLDSSLITALMTEQTRKPVTTYTIAFTDADRKFEAMPDDQKYAKVVAKHLGSDYREIILEPNITDLLPKMVWHLDEPIADPAGINTYLICKLAKESGTTVMLSGMGADEIFGGYRKHLSVKIASAYKLIPKMLRAGVIESVVDALPVANESGGFKLARWAKRFTKSASLPDFDAFIGNYAYYNEAEMRRLLTPEFADAAMPDYAASYPIRRHYEFRDELLERQSKLDLVTLMCAVDTKLFLASLNLMYSDKTSMAAGVEERVPFVDYRIVEFAHRLPAKYKISNLTQKYLLKRVGEKYLPHEIIYRPKAPFGAPLRSWVRKDLDEMIGDLLSTEQVKKRGIFNPQAISKMIADHKSGREDSAHRIWALLTLELWYQQFIDHKPAL